MGSEKYPYKGVLDLLANRCLASGTNAWTDTDHTCYTMTTAGHEGFLKLLPIYVDHLLYPTLTESAFVTEVHHINAEAEDAGVVYCEMQARENSGENRCHLSMLRAMFPGDCGYKSEAGGLLKNLRESTTNEKIHAYHKEFYRPENMCIIIAGQIEPEKVFEALRPIEDKILNEDNRKPFQRPWQSAVPSLDASVDLNVDYPCDEDEYGIVIISWRGPEAKDFSQLISVQILMEYLTDTSISPLQREFVETDNPFCNHVDYTVIENSVSCIYLHFSNVPVKKLSLMKDRLFKIFEKIADGSETLDMNRMETVIQKKKLYILSHMESNPHDQLAMCLIGDFLYGTSVEDLQHRVQQIPIIEKLLEKNADFWTSLLRSYLVEGKYVLVLGHPSPKLAEEMAAEEKQRVEEQQKKLGPEGLKLKEEILKKAIKENEILPPEDIIASVSVPSVQSIKFHSIERSCNKPSSQEQALEKFPLPEMPCRFQLDVVHSNFVRLYVLLDTSDVPQILRMFLPLFVELVVESPIRRNGELIPYQQVVKQLAQDTVSITASLGLDYSRFSCQKYAQVICLELMVEEERYLRSIQWVRELLYQTVFEPSRIKTTATKMISDVARMKRSGSSIAKMMMKNLCFSNESNHWAASMLRQHHFLTELLETLESQSEEVVGALNELRDIVTKADKITVHLATNLPNLKEKTSPGEGWTTDFLPPDLKPSAISGSIKQCYELVHDFSSEATKGVITGVGSVESSFLLQCAPCMNSYTHADYPALLVLIQYLTQLEGPMWRQIRGMGLSYSYSIFVRPNEGLIYFVLFKSTHLVKAYKEGFNIIESHLKKETTWDSSLLESACSSLVFEIIEKEKTIADITEQSLAAYYKNIDTSFTKTLLEQISKVKTTDMERVGAAYLKPLFDTKLSRCTICCHPSKVNDIAAEFKQLSRELTVVPSLEDSFMAKY